MPTCTIPTLPRSRLGIFGVGACGLLMAIAIPEAYGRTGLLFGVSYWIARLVMLALVHGQQHRRAYTTFTVAACLTGPLLSVGGLLHGRARFILWAVAAVVDLTVPLVARRRLTGVPFQADHLVERYGTFILIALGETVVATATGAGELDTRHVASVLAAFALVCGLWWVYFTFGPDAMRTALTAARAPIDLIRPVLSYGHLAMVAGIVAIAASLAQAVGEPCEPLGARAAGLLCGGIVVYLVTFAFTRWRLFHTLAVPRLATAAVVALAWMLHGHLTGLQLLVGLAGVVVALDAVELRVLPRTLHPDAAGA